MINENPPPRQFASGTGASSAAEGSYVDWPAILAGSIFALAISFLLISFGAGLGLSLTSPFRGEGVSAAWLAIAAGIWFAWVMVTGFGAGGYLAGRMRRRAGDATADEVAVRDGGHGLLVWATGALVSSVLAAAGVGGALNIGANAVGTAASTVADVASEAASSDYFANVLLRRGVEPPQTGAEAAAGAEAADGVPADQPAGQPAGQPDAQTAPAAPTTRQAATNNAAIDPAVQQQIAGILARSAASGDMAERDRSYLAQLVAANSDLGADEARARVDTVITEIDAARAAALEAVEKARVAAVVFGFIAAATLLIGAVAAFFAATLGGRHRDEGLGLDALVARR